MTSPKRIVTWNVNSIRTRIERVLAWLDANEPDVVLLQETKCTDDQFAELAGGFDDRGYRVAHHGTDHRNGVAIASRVGLDDVTRGFAGLNRPPYDEPRLMASTCGGIRFHSVYVPNGRELGDPHYLYKLVWLERLRAEIDPAMPTVCAGDLNVAPTDLDIYDPARWRRRTHASPPERAAIGALVDRGLRDVGREHRSGPEFYTWWSYRPGQFEANRGLRIDLALCNDAVADRVSGVWVDTVERAGARPSDHAPLVVDLAPPGDAGDRGAGER